MREPLSILAVTNIYPSPARPTLGVFVEQQIKGLCELGLKVRVHYVNRAEQGMGAYFKMLSPLAEAVQEHQPLILHVMYGGIMAERITAWNRRLPKIVTFHGSDLLGENLSGLARQWISQIGIWCSRRAAKRANGVVVVSPTLKKVLPEGMNPAKVRVIPCGIDLRRFRPLDRSACQRELSWDPGKFHVVFASNNGDPVKRPELAVQAVGALKTSGRNAELHFLRGIANSEVPLWLNAGDALLLTSLHEGSPTVVKEALACGLPVVSVDVGDVSQRIRAIEGCHLAAANPQDLAAKLRLVAAARRRINATRQIEPLNLLNIARQLETFYLDTLRGLGRTRFRPSLASSLSTTC